MLVAGLLQALPGPGAAQTPSTPAPAPGIDSLADYVFADVKPAGLDYEAERYSLKPVFAVITDYTFFKQDDASLAQVRPQEDSADLRAARLGLFARSKGRLAWEGYLAADFQEKRTRDNQTFQLYDLRFRVPVGPVTLDFGKQKQRFSYEIVGLSLLNPQQERILSPFFVTRSIGIQASGQMAGDRMTWSAGWFNDWLETNATFSDNADDYVARITGLAAVSPDDRGFVHLGLGLRRVGPDAGTVRLSGRPESNVADRYMDTGDFAADYVGEVGLELVWNRGPFTLFAEHIAARTGVPASGDPRFSGSYVMLSWVLTGESRPYVRSAGSTGPIAPFTHRGAIELVARYSHLDLRDGSIDGGVLGKSYFGANWWASRQWKAGIGYGDADLDRGGASGRTRMLLFRLQWYY